MSAKGGYGGSPLLILTLEGYFIRGIHSRRIDRIIPGGDGTFEKKGAFKLSFAMFKDIQTNFRTEAKVQNY